MFRTDGGELKVPAARISAYTAPTPIGVRLADGAIAAVTVAPVDSELAVTFDDATTRRIAVADIEAIGSPTDLDALEKIQIDVFRPFLMFWGASGSVGFSDKSGNSQARGISVTLDVERKAPKDRIALTGGIARESQPNDVGDLVPAVAKQYAGVRFDFYFNPRFFTFAATLQERDKFQDLDLRSNYNAGLGVQAVASRVTDLRFSLASGVRAEYYTGNGHNTAAVLTSDLGYKQRLGFATLDWKGGWAPNIKDFGDYRLRSNATLTASIYAGLGFRVGLLNEFNRRSLT